MAVDPADITLTPGALDVTPAFGSITMNADGTITVAPGTTAGTYTYTYEICEIVNPTNCDTAIATVVVAAPVIDALDDDYTATPVNGFAGGALPSVLGNDLLNGVAVDPADITLTPGALDVTPASGSITMNPDGTITVAAGTTAGTYNYTYEICDIANPTNCDTAIATVVVAAPVIDAVDDTPTAVSGIAGATLPSVLGNDTLNGAPVDPAGITLTPGTAPTPTFGSITMNADGTITVAAGTTAGTYVYEYTICEILNPTNCDTATATIIVDQASIDAVDDAPATVNSYEGATTPSVLGNDSLNGAPVDPADITLTPGALDVTPASGSITMNPDGTITVAAGTTAGTYVYEYTICEIINPANCDTAIATIVVAAAVIDAVDDDYTATPVNGADGGSTPSVLGNDTLNGAPVDPADIILTPGALDVTPASGSITMNPDGTITVAAGTTAGTYAYSYEICDIVNPANCDIAVATIVVAAAVIDAVDDDYSGTPVNGYEGATTVSVLGNDTLNGVAVDPADVTLTPGVAPVPASGSITMNPDGTITVAAGTTAGTYTYPYTICEILNPTNCDTATATIVVTAPVIDAVDDTPAPVNGADGGSTPSVLLNDTLNGVAVDPAEITLTPGTAPAPASGSITMNPDGTITVAAGTTAGTYTYPYTICEILNPENCDTAVATIVVTAPAIDAVDDAPAPVNGADGGSTPSVLGNDTLNGVAVDPADVTLTPGTAPVPASGSITMNPDGTITVAAGTTAGTYTYEYTICEILNPENCDTATATVVVAASGIDAVDDAPAPVNGTEGATTPSVLGNDTLNGVAVDPALITLTPGAAPAPASGSITMNPDGTITIAAGTTAGTYTYPYTICEILNPTNCDTAVATIVVTAPAIDAVDDAPAQVNGTDGATTPSVLLNDTLNGVAVDPALITLTPGAAPTPAAGSITMNPDGTITIAAGTTAGTYTYEYTICEILNPTNCDTAVATIVVAYASIALEKTGTVDTGDDDVANVGDTITYAFRVTNTGSVPLTDVMVDDPLVTVSGGPIASLAAGASDSSTFTASHVLTQADLDAGRFENSATVSGTDPDGTVVTDVSDDPADPANVDPNGDGNPDDPTIVELEQVSTIELLKTDEIDLGANGLADVGDPITYAFTVTNTGNVTLTDVVITDPLVSDIAGGPILVMEPGDSDSTTFTAIYRLTQADIDAGQFVNSATATGTPPQGGRVTDISDDPEGGPGDDDEPTVTPFQTAAPQLEATKSVSNRSPILGEVVTYTLVFENNEAVEATAIRLIDDLPSEVQYVPDSARVDGLADEPEREGGHLVWQPVTIAAGSRATVTFEATVTTLEAGEVVVNQTWAEDPDGDRISNVAEAELSRRAEHVFDCTDVIGKVFDDLDGDGYQDEGEPGMAGARIVTLSGQLITVDEHGRFSVPCAALPADTGENISLKLDTRSLPTGYRVTTENPRVVRGTAGKMVRVNFGVSIGKLSDIDLMDAAFAPGGADMTQPLHDGLAQLVEMLRDKPGVLRLSYYERGEDPRLIDARLDAVEARIRTLWQDRGRYKLIIERSVKRIQ